MNFAFSKQELVSKFLYSIFIIFLGIILLYTKIYGLIFVVIYLVIYYLKNRDLSEVSLYLALLLITNIFEFANLEQMPYLQLMAGVRFNLLDLITVLNFIFIFNKILHFDKTPSKWIVNFVLLTSILYVIIGFVLTLTPRGAGTNYLRVLFYISFYYFFFLYLKDISRLKKLICVVSFWVIIATILQIIEYFQNYRFTLPGVIPHSEFYSEEGQKLFTVGTERIYLWSRVTLLMFINLPFVITIYALTRQKFFLLVSILSFIGFFIALSRIWFLGLALILIVTVIFSEKRIKFRAINIVVLILGVLIIFQTYSLLYANFDLISAILGRTHSIITLGRTYGEMDTFTIRVYLFNKSFNKFLESPLFGWGFGEKIWNEYFTIDLGLINRFVFFGLFGVLPLLYYIISYILKLIKEIIIEEKTLRRSLLISVAAVFIGHFPMYLWQIDFWGQNYVIAMALIMAIGDKLILREI